MEDALYHKFIQHSTARALLLSTGDQSLMFVEPEDNYWGDGPDGLGLNEIGKVLMRIRNKLREAGYS